MLSHSRFCFTKIWQHEKNIFSWFWLSTYISFMHVGFTNILVLFRKCNTVCVSIDIFLDMSMFFHHPFTLCRYLILCIIFNHPALCNGSFEGMRCNAIERNWKLKHVYSCRRIFFGLQSIYVSLVSAHRLLKLWSRE